VNRRIIVALLLSGLLATACGTRRDNADFGALGASGEGIAASEGVAGEGGVDGVDSGGGPAGGGTQTAPDGTTPGAPGTDGKAPGGGRNGASDVGVTASTITIGNVISVKGLAGPDQFPPYYFGAAAFFNDVNARGGINGRKVVFQTCDDTYTASGNVKCVRNLVDKSKVFSFVASACGICDGFTYAADKKVPAIHGLTTDFRGYALPHTWNSQGNPYPQNGKIGWKGKVYYGTGVYRFFKEKYKIAKAGIIYYEDAAPSKNAALGFAEQMKAEGIEPFLYGLNVALPQYDSAVLDMKSRGVQGLWDAIDIVGNQNLCKSIDSNGLKLTAKVSSSAAWTQQVGKTFSKGCRQTLFATEFPGSVPYSETSNPEVAKFRAAMKRYFPEREDKLYQWTLNGWATAMQFTDAATACGADLTRACLEKNLDKEYGARGLWTPRSNKKINFDTTKTTRDCISVAQWDDAKNTFVTRALPTTCYTTPLIGQALS
jgi:branched-chain amino acid transport system substrate-binding protein